MTYLTNANWSDDTFTYHVGDDVNADAVATAWSRWENVADINAVKAGAESADVYFTDNLGGDALAGLTWLWGSGSKVSNALVLLNDAQMGEHTITHEIGNVLTLADRPGGIMQGRESRSGDFTDDVVQDVQALYGAPQSDMDGM